jgi:hypothetical protein
VREIVIVITDLYLPEAGVAAPASVAGEWPALPGFGQVARFGRRTALSGGWRAWLAQRLGRADLADAALAAVAAAALPERPDEARGTDWIATPLHLSAGLTRVHLDHRGLIALTPQEQALLAADFQRTFAPGAELSALVSGDFLLRAPALAPLAAIEPARRAGMEVADALPRAAQAGALRRLLAEIEMWLHLQPLNETRRQQGALPVTTLWLWGAEGRMIRPGPPRAAAHAVSAYGRDAWLAGLMRLQGGELHRLPAQLAAAPAPLTVWVLEAGAELQRAGAGTLAEALGRLDERFVSAAVAALRRGAAERLTLLLNDCAVTLTRRSRWRLWRRRRAGLEGFR